MSIILVGSVASFVGGLGSGVRALVGLYLRCVSERFIDASLGFAAGVMLGATCFCLLVRAIETGGIWRTVIGILLGAMLFVHIGRLTQHTHRIVGGEGPPTHRSKIWLFILAIALHNFPEGIAVGLGFGGGDMRTGTILAIGIWLQNIPEGLAVVLPLLRERLTRPKVFWIALLTGLVESVGAFRVPTLHLEPA